LKKNVRRKRRARKNNPPLLRQQPFRLPGTAVFISAGKARRFLFLHPSEIFHKLFLRTRRAVVKTRAQLCGWADKIGFAGF
jgi:hypothetical protein